MDARVLSGTLALLQVPLHRQVNVAVEVPDDAQDYDITLTLNLRSGYLYGPQAQVTAIPARVKE